MYNKVTEPSYWDAMFLAYCRCGVLYGKPLKKEVDETSNFLSEASLSPNQSLSKTLYIN